MFVYKEVSAVARPRAKNREPQLSLIAPVSRGEQGDAVIPIRWCVTQQIVHYLLAKQILDPAVLIVVTNGGKEMSRRLVPLHREMEYITFRRPGTNVVHATIVGRTRDSAPDIGKYFLGRSKRNDPDYSGYAQQVLAWQKDEIISDLDDGLWRTVGEDVLDVVVPEGMFAKAPPQWLGNLARRFFSSTPRDQCHFRKRALLAPLMLLYAVLFGVVTTVMKMVVLVVLVLFGARHINWSAILHPWKRANYPNALWRNSEDSIWYYKKDGSETFWVWWVVNPGVLAVFAAIVSALTFVGGMSWLAAIRDVLIVVGVIVLALVVANAYQGIRDWTTSLFQRGMMSEADREKWAKSYYKELSALACDGPRRADIKDLASSRRTFHLRFQAIKAQVCRPFAR